MKKILFETLVIIGIIMNLMLLRKTFSGSGKWRKKEETILRNLSQTSVFKSTQISLSNLKIRNIPFISSLKNPCWFPDEAEGNAFELRCLPYFFIAGMPKSATSDLYAQILEHEEVFPSDSKEMPWWTENRFFIGGTWNKYLEFFKLSSHLYNHCGLKSPSQASNVSVSCKRLIAVDATPANFWKMGKTIMELKALEKRKHSSQTSYLLDLLETSQLNSKSEKSAPNHSTYIKYTLADVIHLVLPKALFIVMLRNPVDRLYSGFRYFKQPITKTKLNFHREVQKSIQIWKDCMKRNKSLRFCVYDVQLKKRMRVRMYVSMYYIYVEDWLKVFPRNQILFIRTEDYKVNQTATMKQIYRHLELSTSTTSRADNTPKPRIYKNINKVDLGPMLPETRRVLTEFYAPFNRELAKILQDKGFLWLD